MKKKYRIDENVRFCKFLTFRFFSLFSIANCKIYNLNGYWNDQALSLEVENCEKTVKLINLYLINK